MSDSGEKRSQSGQKLGLIGIGIHLNPQDEYDDAPYDHILGFFEDIYLRFRRFVRPLRAERVANSSPRPLRKHWGQR